VTTRKGRRERKLRFEGSEKHMIEQGILNPHTLIEVGQGITKPKYAIVHINGQSQRCVVKIAGHREIAAECFCSLLGSALGLPTLQPIIVRNPKDNSLCFGSREASYPSLSAHLGIANYANAAQMLALAKILSSWSQLGHVISFDELIANGDRNPGNVLWNGAIFTIIDHERALGIVVKNENKLARFATNNFDPVYLGSVQSASTAAALAQQSMLSANSQVLDSVTAEFAGAPIEISQHAAYCVGFTKKLLPSMAHNTANAMSPLFAKQTP
jgi:hypothetical protein